MWTFLSCSIFSNSRALGLVQDGAESMGRTSGVIFLMQCLPYWFFPKVHPKFLEIRPAFAVFLNGYWDTLYQCWCCLIIPNPTQFVQRFWIAWPVPSGHLDTPSLRNGLLRLGLHHTYPCLSLFWDDDRGLVLVYNDCPLVGFKDA